MHLIGLGHAKGVGKDSLASFLVNQHGYVRLAFADPLKELVYAIDPEVRLLINAHGWETAKGMYGGYVRQRLITVGMAARDFIHPAVWIDALLARTEPEGRYVVTDVRMPNEAAALKEAGAYLVNVTRPGYEPDPTDPADSPLIGWDGWDHEARNEGPLEELAVIARYLAAQALPLSPAA